MLTLSTISLNVSACCPLLIKLSIAINVEETQHLKFREQNSRQSRAEGGHPLYAGVWRLAGPPVCWIGGEEINEPQPSV